MPGYISPGFCTAGDYDKKSYSKCGVDRVTRMIKLRKIYQNIATNKQNLRNTMENKVSS